MSRNNLSSEHNIQNFKKWSSDEQLTLTVKTPFRFLCKEVDLNDGQGKVSLKSVHTVLLQKPTIVQTAKNFRKSSGT
jgi:hypothetical protein